MYLKISNLIIYEQTKKKKKTIISNISTYLSHLHKTPNFINRTSIDSTQRVCLSRSPG